MLTDQNEMLELMKHNIKLNQVENKATASILNWYVAFSRNLDLAAATHTRSGTA